MLELRKVEKRVANNWIVCRMSDLKDGDLFRMFEPDGKPVTYKGSSDLYAISNPRPHPKPEGNWQVETL